MARNDAAKPETEGDEALDETPEEASRRIKHPGRKSVGWALVHAARLQRARLGDRLTALGLFPGQDSVLQVLAAEEALTVGELADVLRVRPPTASKAVTRLKALGMLERTSNGSSRRSVHVVLTKKGRDLAEVVETIGREVEEEMLAGLDPKDRKALRKLLRKAAANLIDAGAPETAGPVPDGAA